MSSVKSKEAQLPSSFFIQANSLWSMMGQLIPRLEKLHQSSPKTAMVLKAPNGMAWTVELNPLALISFLTDTLNIREDFAENMILVFKHIGSYHFLITVFNGDGCVHTVNECSKFLTKEECITKRSDSKPRGVIQDDRCKAKVENMQSFSIFLVKTAVNRRIHSIMWLPRGFTIPKEQQKTCDATIRVGQKEWKARMCFNRKGGDAYFTGAGWLSLVKQNRLKVGDECIFTLIDKSKWIFNLHIPKMCRYKEASIARRNTGAP